MSNITLTLEHQEIAKNTNPIYCGRVLIYSSRNTFYCDITNLAWLIFEINTEEGAELLKLLRIADKKEIDNYIITLMFKSMTLTLFKEIIDMKQEKAYEEVIKSIQRQLRSLLGVK
jgi:uncharacterized membrane protein